MPAGELKAGDKLVSHHGRLIEVASVCSTEAVATVYNLRVADHHTYFVGGTIWGWDVWVHNAEYNVHQTPIKPGIRNRPDPARSIDTRVIENSSGYTAQGFPRDNIGFWQEWARRHPETISDVNLNLIHGINPMTGRPQRATSPRVDATWLKFNPQHAEYEGHKLIHHHALWVNPESGVLEPGPYAFPVPMPTHMGQEKVWHG